MLSSNSSTVRSKLLICTRGCSHDSHSYSGGHSVRRWNIITLLVKHKRLKMYSTSFQKPAQQTESLRQTTLLMSCTTKGDVEGVQQLLDDGVPIDSCDYDKRTALHLAASEGHVPVAELLLKRGANVNPQDRWGDTVHSSHL